jgi:hypothetical protein
MEKTMRRSASEIIRKLERRIAQLEKQARGVREGGKIGFLRPQFPTGRYSWSKVEKIVGDTVFLNEGGWNKFEMSLTEIIGLSQELSKDVPNKYLIKIK